jgi:hypothetical protein
MVLDGFLPMFRLIGLSRVVRCWPAVWTETKTKPSCFFFFFLFVFVVAVGFRRVL